MYVTPEALQAWALVACDACGTVALMHLAPGWRRFNTLADLDRAQHHCPACVERNEAIRSGIIYRVDPGLAVTYDG